MFRHLLCEEGGIDFDSLGPKGFQCLWSYFSVVNMEAKALSGSSTNKACLTCILGACLLGGKNSFDSTPLIFVLRIMCTEHVVCDVYQARIFFCECFVI